MLQLSIIFLFVSNLPRIFGPLHGEKTSHMQQNGLKGMHGNFSATSIDITTEKTGLETLHTLGKTKTTGQTLGDCYGGTGRWIVRNLSSKNSRKNQMCYCRCSVKSGKNAVLAKKECYECLKAEGRDGSATVDSTDGAATTEIPVALHRSANAPTKATSAVLGSHQYTVSRSVQHHGGRRKKTYRSKKSDKLPKTSAKGPSECSCEMCLGKSCLYFCEILTPFAFCLALPYLCLEACCLRSCDPIDDYCKSICPQCQ